MEPAGLTSGGMDMGFDEDIDEGLVEASEAIGIVSAAAAIGTSARPVMLSLPRRARH
jgi:hypothetical protein